MKTPPLVRVRWALAALAMIISHLACGAPLIVAAPKLPPDIYALQDGSPGGIFGEILNRIAALEGWTLKTRSCTWSECMSGLYDGTIDLLPDARHTAEREKTLDFNRVPVAIRSSQLYTREGVSLNTPQDLNGKTIAVLKGSLQEETLRNFFAAQHLTASLIAEGDLEETFRATAAGRADAALADYLSGAVLAPAYHLVATPLVFETGNTFYAALKGRQPAALEKIDTYLQRWKADPNSVYYDILKRSGYPQAASGNAWYRDWRWLLPFALLALTLATFTWRQHRHGRRLAQRLATKEREILQTRSERDQIQAQTDRSASFDTLTQLPNRQMLYTRIEQALIAVRMGAAMSAIMILDLNNFRRVNEIYGLKAGDQILQAVAQRILRNTRPRDTVARTSGDEFTILLTEISKRGGDVLLNVARIAEKLRTALTAEPYEIGDKQHTIRVSIGYRLLNDATLSVTDFLQHADIARHWSRDTGGSKAIYFREHLRAQIEHELALEHDLKQAIGSAQMTMHIQPQFSNGGDVSGAELLMRWDHPIEGAISPQVFIPIAEESDLIQKLTDWSIQEACRALNPPGQAALPFPLSINISRRCLEDPSFISRVRHIIQGTGAAPQRLIFEITESLWTRDVRVTGETIQALCDMGIRFSMDDFGTGYSNLAHLGNMPLYEIKIDKTLIDKLSEGKKSTAIVDLVLTMAKNLGLRIVAEGVETHEQRQYLFAHGCSAIQGYLTAKPMPLDDWLRQHAGDRYYAIL